MRTHTHPSFSAESFRLCESVVNHLLTRELILQRLNVPLTFPQRSCSAALQLHRLPLTTETASAAAADPSASAAPAGWLKARDAFRHGSFTVRFQVDPVNVLTSSPVSSAAATSSTTAKTSSHVTRCSDSQKNYCVNGGECFTLEITPGSTKFLCR